VKKDALQQLFYFQGRDLYPKNGRGKNFHTQPDNDGDMQQISFQYLSFFDFGFLGAARFDKISLTKSRKIKF